MGRLFGTDGIRGPAGEHPLDPSTTYKLGKQVARLGAQKVVLGRDTRASGIWIERVLQEGIEAGGGKITRAGIITTPGIAYLAATPSFDAGIAVSASHNPYQDNGIKIFWSDGIKLSDSVEESIERAIAEDQSRFPMPQITEESFLQELNSSDPVCFQKYLNFLKRASGGRLLKHLKVVMDCGHGAAVHVASRVFEDLGAEVIALNTKPNGQNINLKCGALYPDQMAGTVVESRATFGVAFDGDSDRSIFADEKGNILDGDCVLYILGRYLQSRGKMKTDCVVSTIMANMGLEIALKSQGLRLVRTLVGDRHVLAEMLRGGHSLGGEQSGHIIIREHLPAGDGILTALKVACIIDDEGQSLGGLTVGLERLPQVLINVPVKEKGQDFLQIIRIREEIEAAEKSLGNGGRVVIRYSGTEPLVRIMLEGDREEEIRERAESIADRFRQSLG